MQPGCDVSLDDFPIRDRNSDVSARAEAAFEEAIAEAGKFVVQQRDRRDYGTDFQLEAQHVGAMTNFRVHTQLKGTEKPANKDGTVSVTIARTNLNYLLSQPNSIYVCYHLPSRKLLARSAEDVFRDAEHEGEGWRSKDSLTVRFRGRFDGEFQSRLHARTLAASTVQRSDRLHWVATPPDDFPDEVATNIPAIVVPESVDEAIRVLKSLFDRGRDDVISKAFEQFRACLGPNDPRLVYAHLSEINLAMRLKQFDRDRVTAAIEFIEASRPDNSADALYCRANGHGALGQTDKAKRLYQEAIKKTTHDNSHLAAQCWKNLGSEFNRGGDEVEARTCYERALALSPNLMEAHMALGMSYRDVGQLDLALNHFNQAVWAIDDFAPTLSARAYRLEVYFRLEMTDNAFDDISAIMPHAHEHRWVFDWCAMLVYNYARINNSSMSRAIRFWDAYLRMRPTDQRAQKERLLCMAYAKMHGQNVNIDYERYVADVSAFLTFDSTDEAHLWDRAGHWAQVDGNWEQAEQHYRRAYSLDPARYGFCLGTALNFLGRFSEALPILVDQADNHQPDAMSWFQVAIAQEGVGNIKGCIESYKRALSLDPAYDLAMFNLGGIYWNYGPKSEATRVWKEALAQFPSHPTSEKLRREYPEIFGERANS
jgi:tetratricopeptide (TPR) repeat protein